MFSLSYDPRWYLTHPWLLIPDVWRNIRWTWQRVFRGWDDRVIWSIDQYLCKMLSIWLQQLKKDKLGIPADFVTGEDVTEVDKASWDATLDKMIAGFEAGYKIITADLPIYEDLRTKSSLYSFEGTGVDEYNEAVDKAGGFERIHREYTELETVFDKGFALFQKYFFNLWD